jgi:hypothetical protein
VSVAPKAERSEHRKCSLICQEETGVYDNQPCRKQDPVDKRKVSASSVGSAVYVVNGNAILQDTQ